MIASKRHLLHITGLDSDGLDALLANTERCYAPYMKKDKKPRKDGTWKERPIEPPKGLLLAVQRRLNKYIQKHGKFPAYVFAGLKKRDAIMNSKFHQGSKFFLTTDMKNFYPSIDNHMVYRALVRSKVQPEPARIITQLVTYKGHVPQGAPTSMIIANLVFMTHLGWKLVNLMEGMGMRFTQYVDDLTFSSESEFKHMSGAVMNLIRQSGLKISHTKTKYGTWAEVTGNRTSSSSMRPKQATFNKAKDPTEKNCDAVQLHIDRALKVAKTPRRKVFA